MALPGAPARQKRLLGVAVSASQAAFMLCSGAMATRAWQPALNCNAQQRAPGACNEAWAELQHVE